MWMDLLELGIVDAEELTEQQLYEILATDMVYLSRQEE